MPVPTYLMENKQYKQSRFIKGTLVGSLIGVIITLLTQFFRRIISQPPLISKVILSDTQEFTNEEARAMFIAAENLRTGIASRQIEDLGYKNIVHAGYRNFRESWARDFGFASYGLITLKEFEPVQDTLETFLHFQKLDGQLPVKLKSIHLVSRFLHSMFKREQPLEGKLTPKYVTGHNSPSYDGQALLIISACEYISATNNLDFARKYWPQMVKAVDWLEQYSLQDSGLLYQKPFADWADSVARQGVVMYTNIVYWKTLKSISQLADELEDDRKAEKFKQRMKAIETGIQNSLWRPELGYFATSDRMNNLSTAGNLLAIAWEFTSQEQAESILSAIKEFDLANPVPTQAAFPSYSRSFISIENRLGNLANYHTNGAWLWIGAWHIIALLKAGEAETAREMIERIAHLLIRDQQVHEVYGLDSQPISNFWYTSEAPLIWSAGMILYAFEEFEQLFR